MNLVGVLGFVGDQCDSYGEQVTQYIKVCMNKVAGVATLDTMDLAPPFLNLVGVLGFVGDKGDSNMEQIKLNCRAVCKNKVEGKATMS